VPSGPILPPNHKEEYVNMLRENRAVLVCSIATAGTLVGALSGPRWPWLAWTCAAVSATCLAVAVRTARRDRKEAR